MKPEEKAKELSTLFFPLADPVNDDSFEDDMNRKRNAKECALIVVNEVLSVLDSGSLYIEQGSDDDQTSNAYWSSVEEALNKED